MRIQKTIRFIVMAGILSSLVTSRGAASYRNMDFSEMVHASDVIVIGTVTDMSSRWGASNRIILTDVTFEVLNLLREPGLADEDLPTEMTITYTGGQIGDLILRVSDMPTFELGASYVVFALHDGKTYINPIVGEAQGLFQLHPDSVTGDWYPVTPGGSAIASVKYGRLTVTPRFARLHNGWAHPAAPSPMDVGPRPADPTSSHVEVKKRIDPIPAMNLSEFEAAILLELSEPTPSHEDPDIDYGSGASTLPTDRGPPGGTVAENQGSALPRAELCWCGFFDAPMVMQQVPETWWSYADNEYSMAAFNLYMDIFRQSDFGSVAPGNDESEFFGFFDDSQIQSVFGSSWGSALAKCFTWSLTGDCTEIIECDIVFNKSVSWTTDLEDILYSDTLRLYRVALNHELGHAFGLQRGTCVEDYSYDRPTVMHAIYTRLVEDGKGIHYQDAKFLRDIYDAQLLIQTVTDIGVESYYANSSGKLRNATTNRTNYDIGDTLTVRNITVENMSSHPLTRPRLRFWLSTNRTITTNDHRMGDHWEWETLTTYWTGDLSMTVPTVSTGDYYVGMIVSVDGASYASDDYTANNRTFLLDEIHVTCPPPCEIPGDSPQPPPPPPPPPDPTPTPNPPTEDTPAPTPPSPSGPCGLCAPSIAGVLSVCLAITMFGRPILKRRRSAG